MQGFAHSLLLVIQFLRTKSNCLNPHPQPAFSLSPSVAFPSFSPRNPKSFKSSATYLNPHTCLAGEKKKTQFIKIYHFQVFAIINRKKNTIFFLLSFLPFFFPSFKCCCFCSVTKQCPISCNFMNCSMPGFPVLHYLRVCSNSSPLMSGAI